MTRLYIGSLAYSATNDSLKKIFLPYGTITGVKVVTDRDTGRSKGFAFVTFEKEEDAKKALEDLNDQEVEGRRIHVDISKPREEGARRDDRKGCSSFELPQPFIFQQSSTLDAQKTQVTTDVFGRPIQQNTTQANMGLNNSNMTNNTFSSTGKDIWGTPIQQNTNERFGGVFSSPGIQQTNSLFVFQSAGLL